MEEPCAFALPLLMALCLDLGCEDSEGIDASLYSQRN